MRNDNSLLITATSRRARRRELAAAALLATLAAAPALAYAPADPWQTTASGPSAGDGRPITLTWSIVGDGTAIPGEGPSNIIASFDGLFGAGAGGTDLTKRPWFRLFQQSFDRLAALSGVTFAYEPRDSHTTLGNLTGVRGIRGDLRIGGANVDGANGTLAYTYLPENGDMVLDVAETSFFSASSNDYRGFRNTLMHELGHALGLQHVNSSSAALLMEPYIDVSFDGPQLDDVRGLQGLYGDALEKSFSGQGNGVAARATNLGAITAGSPRTIGADAGGTQAVSPSETDFLSIANATDVDYFSFTVSSPMQLSATLAPLGGVFMQGVEGGNQASFNANSRNNLALSIFAADGATLLASANSAAAGAAEALTAVSLAAAGTYFARVTGATDNVQLYQLSLSVAAAAVTTPSADFNGDQLVDGADLLVWQRGLGLAGSALPAHGDSDFDRDVDAADLANWRSRFGAATGSVAVVAEPSCWPLACCAAWIKRALGRRRSRG